jgi:hypothetical protein
MMNGGRRRFSWPFRIALGLVLLGSLVVLTLPAMVRRSRCDPKNNCITNLKQLDGAIQQWALENKKLDSDVPDLAAAAKYLKGGVLPQCPHGGSYAAGKTVADAPTCTKAKELGHSLPY